LNVEPVEFLRVTLQHPEFLALQKCGNLSEVDEFLSASPPDFIVCDPKMLTALFRTVVSSTKTGAEAELISNHRPRTPLPVKKLSARLEFCTF